MNHPHIARIYDGGITENGRPYLVMEYVDGEPVTSGRIALCFTILFAGLIPTKMNLQEINLKRLSGL